MWMSCKLIYCHCSIYMVVSKTFKVTRLQQTNSDFLLISVLHQLTTIICLILRRAFSWLSGDPLTYISPWMQFSVAPVSRAICLRVDPLAPITSPMRSSGMSVNFSIPALDGLWFRESWMVLKYQEIIIIYKLTHILANNSKISSYHGDQEWRESNQFKEQFK